MAEGGKTTLSDAIEGLREEERIIMEDLLDYWKELYVISIVGMPGVGKTTLASTLYNSPLVADHFDIRTWCTVSQSYQIRALLLSILHPVNASDQVNNMDDQDLADHLCRKLKGRRFLIVLDDVWDTGLWSYLKTYLPNIKGNRILITTRNRDVAVQIGSKVNELHGLSKESSLKLFKKKMLEIESLSDNLMSISEGIVEDCKGLPLSIVIIAGILSDIERTETRWKQIAESVSSIVLSDPQGNCKAILGLSYNQLPDHLRLCFLYLGSFPEDKEISVNHLTSLWIAEGLVGETDSAEEVAKKYIGDLIDKSLVIPAKNRSPGGVKTFLLHDLLHDFCLDKAKEKHFLTFLDKTNYSQPLQDTRRVIINRAPIKGLDFPYQNIRSIICYDEFDVFGIKKGIRSCDMLLLEVLEVDKVCSKLFPVWDEDDVCSKLFQVLDKDDVCSKLFQGRDEDDVCSKLFQVLDKDDVCSKLFQVWDEDDVRSKLFQVWEEDYVCSKLFRVWDEYHFRLNSFPDISSLAHLRYLAFGLEDWVISSLPSSICKLQNLQTLILRFKSLVEVPDLIWDMVKLRHVHISPTASFEVDSNRLEKSSFLLGSLRFLSRARVSCGDRKWLSKLSGLQRLSCAFMEDDSEADDDLEVGDAMEVDAVEDNRFQMLSFNGHLTSLKVENATNREQRFISRFQLPYNLRELTLSNFVLTSDDISKIGRAAPHLEFFKTYSCYVPCVWNVHNDDFPKLKVLKLRNLNILKWTASEDSFPSLEQLWLDDCKYLDEIPLEFGCLPELRLISVKKCSPSVDKSARIIENRQHEDQNTRMRVHIHLQKYHFNKNSDAIVGLHEEARIIVEDLLMGGNHLDVISVIGMGGAGKTTLASTVYRNPSIVNHFEILAWCTVSQSHQYRDSMLSIIDQFDAPDKSHRTISNIQELGDHLHKKLKKRRYLIVLDDVWDTKLWNYLKRYLPDSREGGRILITTRNRKVADQIGSKVIELHGLSEEKSWEFFQQKMLGKGRLSVDLLNISKEIVKNCKGSPRSIVAVAGLLSSTERTEEKWNQIAEKMSSFVLSGSRGKRKITSELSYTALPHDSRSCFFWDHF